MSSEHPTDHWARLASWFERASDAATPEEVERIVALALAEDPELGRELDELLREDRAATAAESTHDTPSGPLAQIISDAATWLDDAVTPNNERLGPYRLLREVGRGGLGTVYLAERADEDFPLQVALKIVDRRFGSPRDRERLIEERRILATLDHPNIARVFDAGTADDGTPYFALEFLEGEPIDRHADRLRLSIEQRLRLFLGLAEAVAYAHRRLVIHRDIKPSNILVSAQGTPKLLDFGIAKVLESERTDLTRAEERMLTPDFASPEQIRGEPLTTATDVYSLGALLYTLLAGRPPFELRGLSPAQVERRLSGEEPPAASVAALRERAGDASGQSAEEIAALRSTTLARLPRLLRGDLDTILARALHKEPTRRYPSVEQFADDVRRHLENRPIAARADWLGYRARRFVRRHRAGVATAALVALAVLGGWLSTAREMRRARIEQARTAQVAGFLVGLFESVDPAVARGSEPTAREILDRGARRLLEPPRAASPTTGRAPDLQVPEVQATLLATVGRVYRQLGHYDEAEKLLRRALTIRRNEGPIETARALVDLAEVGDDRHDYDAAARLLAEALALQSQALPRDHPDRAATLFRLASVELGRGEATVAERHLDEALTIRRTAFGERSLAVAEVRHAHAQICYRTGRLDEAEAELARVLTLRRELVGDDHPLVLTTLNDLASVRHDRGDLAGATELLQKTVGLRRAILGADHPYVATALLNLATVARKSGDLDGARTALFEALGIYRGAFGEEHARTAEALGLLAKVDHARGDLANAETLARRALGIQRRKLGDEHVEVARTRLALGMIARDARRLDEAEREMRECLRVQAIALGADDPALAFALLPLGQLLVERGRVREAEPLLRRAVALRETAFPEGHWRIAEAQGELALALRAAGREGATGSINRPNR